MHYFQSLLRFHVTEICIKPLGFLVLVMEPVSYFMTYRDRAVIATGATSPDLGDKEIHNTFIR